MMLKINFDSRKIVAGRNLPDIGLNAGSKSTI